MHGRLHGGNGAWLGSRAILTRRRMLSGAFYAVGAGLDARRRRSRLLAFVKVLGNCE
jgi:hypothetical protein